MNYRIGKFLLIFTAFTVISVCANTFVYASDYQYKVLDPKYNPDAQKVVDGTLPPIEEVLPDDSSKGFDFGLFFAIAALVILPTVIIGTAVKSYKKVFEEIPGTQDSQNLGNVRINVKNNNSKITSNKQAVSKTTDPMAKRSAKNNGNAIDRNIADYRAQKLAQRKLPNKANNSINQYFTESVRKKIHPLLLNTNQLASNKGLCLVQYNDKYSLIGYVNDEIFILNKFEKLNSLEIRSRLSESVNSKDRYIVRLGNYKALVEVSDSKMDLLLEL